MAKLVITSGPDTGTSFELDVAEAIIGRQNGAEIKLSGTNISRSHARVLKCDDAFFLEDLKSSNGTYLNGAKISGQTRLSTHDEIRVGSYVLRFDDGDGPFAPVTIQARAEAHLGNTEIFLKNSGQKLQVVLQLAHQLGRSLDAQQLLSDLANYLFDLFPQAERALIVTFNQDQPIVRVSRHRSGGASTPQYSRSIFAMVRNEGVGVVAEDTQSDTRFQAAHSIVRMGVRSFMCVPLKPSAGKVLGAIQLDRFVTGGKFDSEDLHMLTAISLQVSAVLENAQLHLELLNKERLERDLAMAREIQVSYLPSKIPELPAHDFDLHAELFPAHEVSGDFYDYFALGPDRLGFAVADVSGKGMPAAIFMSSVRVLLRQFATRGKTPGEILSQLNNALAQDNPKMFYVTIALGIYEPGTGLLQVTSGGHPPGLLARASGDVIELSKARGQLLGFDVAYVPFEEHTLRMEHGDTLLLYTDGITETAAPNEQMFGTARLKECLTRECRQALPELSAGIRKCAADFSGGAPQDDDITMVLLRRR